MTRPASGEPLAAAPIVMDLEIFKKLPLGGVDRRSLVDLLADKGATAAQELLARQRADLRSEGAQIPDDVAVLILGGSNGITRALAAQLVFGEKTAVFGVHYDSAKMQIGVHHVAALEAAAADDGLTCRFLNRDATRDKTIEEVVGLLKDNYRAVHLINGIAAGATKRYEKFGPTTVKDLDVAFDPVMQVPDFGNPDAYRRVGMVEVEVATEAEIERTNKFMGSSSLLWVEPLSEAGLIKPDESIVGFCDYDFEKQDPVYGMGPLAGAKILQRETMEQIRQRFGARTVRICYPAMATTALGAIPGGMLMFALTAQILMERTQYKSLTQLAAASMALFVNVPDNGELRLDGPYQATLPEFHVRKDALGPDSLPDAFSQLYAHRDLIP
jgi:enoyl-[acyl-carrier protein] reductase/trans-2-enoyl-CoA reductase (NAD+)